MTQAQDNYRLLFSALSHTKREGTWEEVHVQQTLNRLQEAWNFMTEGERQVFLSPSVFDGDNSPVDPNFATQRQKRRCAFCKQKTPRARWIRYKCPVCGEKWKEGKRNGKAVDKGIKSEGP
jgi:hypothetical protein